MENLQNFIAAKKEKDKEKKPRIKNRGDGRYCHLPIEYARIKITEQRLRFHGTLQAEVST